MKRINVVSLSLTMLILLTSQETPRGFSQQSPGGRTPNRRASSWTYIDTAGNSITDLKFDATHDFSEGLAAVRIGNHIGYIERDGKIVIEPVFCDGGPFINGLAYVSSRKICQQIEGGKRDLATAIFGTTTLLERMYESEYGFIDTKGTFIIEPKFGMVHSFRDGYALVAFRGEWQYIDRRGNFLSAYRGYSIVTPTDFSEGLAAAPYHSSYKWYFFDKSGKKAFDTKDWQQSVDSFSDGVARITGPGFNVMYVRRDGTFIGEDGQSGDARIFEEGGNFSEGIALVRVRRCWHYIDKAGETPFRGCLRAAQDFSEGLAAIESNGKWGFIDKTGKMKIMPSFEDARRFSGGLAAVKSRGKWGFIDRDGRFQIKPSFQAAHDFSDGRVAVIR